MEGSGEAWVVLGILCLALGTILGLALLIFCGQRRLRRRPGELPVFVLPFASSAAFELRLPDTNYLPGSARRSSSSPGIRLKRYERFKDEPSMSTYSPPIEKSETPSTSTSPSSPVAYRTAPVTAQRHRIEVNSSVVLPSDDVSLALERRSQLRKEMDRTRASLAAEPDQAPPPLNARIKLTREIAEAIASECMAESSVMLDGGTEESWLDGTAVLNNSRNSLASMGDMSAVSPPPSGGLRVVRSQRTQF